MTIDLNKYREAYLNEARSYVKAMNRTLVELEKNPNNKKLFNDIFRATHTLKSISSTMGYEQNASLCHAMEDVFDAISHNKISLAVCTDLMFKCFDQLAINLKKISKNKAEIDASHLIQELQHLVIHKKSSEIANFESQQQLETEVTEKIQTVEVKVERLDTLMNLAEEFLVNKMKFEAIIEQLDNPELTPAIESFGRLVTELQYHIMQARLVPAAFIFNRFLRMTRDLAKQQKKEIELQIEGADIELDRILVDELIGSITHLIRNAIDHGIELPDVRLRLKKKATGTIKLQISRSKEVARIEISDDGSGLDLPEIKKIAIKHNLISHDANDEEIIETIFSGISTAKSVTSLSGRGLGLSIVKQKIESIGGTLDVKSIPHKGTTFVIEFPLSLAIIKTLFVTVGEEIYAIPIDFVERLLIAEPADFKGIMNDEAIIFEKNDIPIIRLFNLFNTKVEQLDKLPVVIIRKGNERIGLVVEKLLSTEEVVIKPLTRSIRDNKYFSGAALIGSGKMILILDVAYLLQIRKRLAN